MENRTIILALVLNAPIFLLIGRMVFGTWEAFWDSFGWVLKPNWLSWWEGNLHRDRAATFMMTIFIVLCGLVVWGEYALWEKLM